MEKVDEVVPGVGVLFQLISGEVIAMPVELRANLTVFSMLRHSLAVVE